MRSSNEAIDERERVRSEQTVAVEGEEGGGGAKSI